MLLVPALLVSHTIRAMLLASNSLWLFGICPILYSLDKRLRCSLDPNLGGKAPQHTGTATKGASTTNEQGREPVNGATGAGTASEPYDQGNSDGE